MTEPFIKVRGLKFTYPGGVTALKNIDLEIMKGEVVAIIGQNGSGKTTLVKHFNGLLKPTRGDVIVNGKDTENFTTSQLSRDVGYVFQNPDDQLFTSKVIEEVRFGPKNLKFSEKEINEKVKYALKITGLLKKRNIHPLDLNLDEKKLLTIASIVAMNPQVIILDEPTGGQDHKGVKKIEKIINELRKTHTIILISHNMDFVARVAGKIIVMHSARILMTGTPKEVFAKPDLLKKTFLKPPSITQLAQSMKGIRNDTLTIDEFVEQL